MSTQKIGRICTKRRRELRAMLPQVCVKCGATKSLTLDHIVARVLGGSNQQSNLQLLCHACNQAKGKLESKEAEARHRMERKMKRAAYFREQARMARLPLPPAQRKGGYPTSAFLKP